MLLHNPLRILAVLFGFPLFALKGLIPACIQPQSTKSARRVAIALPCATASASRWIFTSLLPRPA